MYKMAKVSQPIFQILVCHFGFPEEKIYAFESAVLHNHFYSPDEEMPKREEWEGPKEDAVEVINKSFTSYEDLNVTEREYLKFVVAWRIASSIQLAKATPIYYEEEEKIWSEIERQLNELNKRKKLIKAFKKGMKYYIPLFQSGAIDESKFYFKNLPEYFGKKMTRTKIEIERELGPGYDLGL